jgi:predicted DsbA family dithiol-disulfide isomerase
MHIDIYHDTVCPWCRIGKKNLQLALDGFNAEPVTITYHTFFLNEGLPPEGADFREYMLAKTAGRLPLEMMFDGPRRAGEKVGVKFNFEKIERAPNTALSHLLIAFTPDDQKVAMIDALYQAYFEDGLDIGQRSVLLDLAQAQGLDLAQVEAGLNDPALFAQVEAEAHAAQEMGITGVPFFIFNGRYALSGAQPPEMFARVLPQVVERSRQEGITP